MSGAWERDDFARAIGVLGAFTLTLTASFIGILALMSGEAIGIEKRLPIYVLIMALAFIGTILLAEQHSPPGGRAIVVATSVSITGLILSILSGEGIVYAIRKPGEVIASNTVLYFLAAGLIGTGIVYWGVNHWREFAQN